MTADKDSTVDNVTPEELLLKAIFGDTSTEGLSDEARARMGSVTAKILTTLTQNEERIVRLLHGIGEEYLHPPEQVGEKFNISPDKVRQIEAKALKKLQPQSRRDKLRD